MMLAEGLGVSPIALLMPSATLDGEPVVTGDELVQATGRPLEGAEVLWREGLLAELPDFGDTTEMTRYMVRYRKPDRKQTMKRGFKTKRDAQEFANRVESRNSAAITLRPRSVRSP
ncbi:Arm DNA-binding domain-containing protein [Mycobacterium sp. MYCO198283]|uniref:Arm DNA-binding domain-containing protein n=1 Tax=Mycobacterium sp. MYCO198283 TaxID=2883505 RepID=UPI001E403A7C|nr:Arm DNA-binding domain-containing protein [Mycobacterium sp. MYCO198283]MCG5431485.1 Arm DNA-binding domain-containing protein [Mycobacterium sp. MYCO198283]